MKRMYTTYLQKELYAQPTKDVARSLLGKVLVHEAAEGITAGRIVETEAYLYQNDPACHASRGQTARNKPMFGAAGTAYIYLIYGIHYCFNVVTARRGVGEAVLIRALEPLAGSELMKARRSGAAGRKVSSGPGNLCRAMAITSEYNGHNLRKRPLYLADDGYRPDRIVTTTRIGITQAAELPLRYYLADNPYVSRK